MENINLAVTNQIAKAKWLGADLKGRMGGRV